ncbi:ATP-binding protein [Leeia oryzae]|uniref:ATP-binding protein n=1 Tax=Leeia oryzae TaxID=356662 RepID=UPI00037EDC4C|nr:ATP-binding protein [Leeia oryzae]
MGIKRRSLSIRQAIFGVIALGLLIPALVNSFISLRYSELSLRQNLDAQGRIILDNLSVSLEQPLWDMSFSTAERLVDSLMRDTRIVRVTITDANFGKFVDRFKPERAHANQWKEVRPIVHEGQPIGRVILIMDDGELRKQLSTQITGIWVLILGQLFISLALISWLLQIRLIRPLMQLMNDSTRLAAGSLDLAFNWSRNDELGMLGKSLEFTRQSLETMVNELEDKNDRLNTDIQIRKQIEEALRASEHRFRTLASNAPVGIFRITSSGRCLFINAYWTSRTGISVESVIGTDWLLLIATENREQVKAAWLEASQNKKEFLAEFRAENMMGAPFWVDCKLLPLVDEQELLTGYIGTLTDISEQKDAETVLLKAKEAAEAANAAKTEFLSNMSHELRTPMHAILSFSDLGERRMPELPPEKAKQYFSRIRASAQRLLTLLNDLLDLSKLEAGRMKYYPETTYLSALVQEVVEEIAPIALSRKIRLVIDGDAREPLQLDQIRIGQVISNVLSNAIRFTPDGSEVIIRLQQPAGHDGHEDGTRLSIIDEGPGVPDHEVELIFDKFIQSSQTKTGAGGTGLGLSISRQILSGHGGYIWAENRQDRSGAIFHVWLPKNFP